MELFVIQRKIYVIMKKAKIIHLKPEILKKIDHVAIDQETKAKNWIEDLIEREVKNIALQKRK